MLDLLRPKRLLGASLALVLAAACQSDPMLNGGDGAGGDAPRDGGIDGLAFPDGGPAPECTKDSDCKGGGYCVGGSCCPTKERVCGDRCCAASETCFANACVTPGKLCYSAADCPTGWYCEPALGPGPPDAGPPPDGKTCLQPVPSAGRCVKLPPKCKVNDAGVPNTDGGCLPPCEYHPKVGKLNATVQWSWGDNAQSYKNHIDVWSTPVVGRLYDTNCDNKINELDPPVIAFVSGDAHETCCSCGSWPNSCKNGVLRVLDGASGKEIWSLRKPSTSSMGFSGISLAIGDVDGDKRMDILAVSGEGRIVMVDGDGKVKRTSDKALGELSNGSFGWGGGLAVADMDADGHPEVAYAATVFTTKGGKITRLFQGTGGIGGGKNRAISFFVDLDGKSNGHLELLAGNTAYTSSGKVLWKASGLDEGFPGVGDFDGDKKPEVVHVAKRQVWVLEGDTGKVELGPLLFPGTSKDRGGPPTVADFDGDGKAEIGVALRQYYYVVKPDYTKKKLVIAWKTENHDLSSSVTGSTVFDFEGDGSAEVVYNDECFLWVYDGKTGGIRFATPTTSFTATEASLVADVDGDGRAEMVMIANGADPGSKGWKCNVAPWNQPDPKTGRPAWKPPAGKKAHRGVTVWRDKANSWVGTRTLWNQHAYHVTNICDNRDTACYTPNVYGSIPKTTKKNWLLPWLNNFRQNVQDKGVFDAPDATVGIKVECKTPVILRAYLRNKGFALLPAGVEVGFYIKAGGTADTLLGKATSKSPLFPGQVAELVFTVPKGKGTTSDVYFARILVDPKNPTFQECRKDNNESPPTKAKCLE